jgi:hypothetical protein
MYTQMEEVMREDIHLEKNLEELREFNARRKLKAAVQAVFMINKFKRILKLAQLQAAGSEYDVHLFNSTQACTFKHEYVQLLRDCDFVSYRFD